MFKHLKSPQKAGGKSLLKGKVLLVLVVMLLCISFSYAANVKYHGLGDDATKIYVKEIKKLPLDTVNYKWLYFNRINMEFLLMGKALKSGLKNLYYDLTTGKIFFETTGVIEDITPDKRYLLEFPNIGKTYYVWDLKTRTKKAYHQIKIFKILTEIVKAKNMSFMKETSFLHLYDQYHAIGVEHTEEKVYWISLGDFRTGEIKRLCKIEGYDDLSLDYIKYFDKDNIFYEVLDENYKSTLYRLELNGCKIKKILAKKYGIVDDMYQGFYRNYKGEIRINLGYEVRDMGGRIVVKPMPIKKRYLDLCGKGEFNGYSKVSPDDKLMCVVLGEIDPEDEDEYWIKGGKECVCIDDFKGRRTKLNLGMGDRRVPDELYWHPLGDRLIMKEKRDKSGLKIIILGRR